MFQRTILPNSGAAAPGIATVLLAGARFEDAVCTCTFAIDVHSPDPDKCKGIASSGKYRTQPYDIPLRALISKDFHNLMMAGRCICGDFLAHSSYRVIGDAVPMGEAAGQAAAKGLPDANLEYVD